MKKKKVFIGKLKGNEKIKKIKIEKIQILTTGQFGDLNKKIIKNQESIWWVKRNCKKNALMKKEEVLVNWRKKI